MDAQGLLDALRAAGLPVKELIIKDVHDSSTWTFVGLTADQIVKAIAIVKDILNPIIVKKPAENVPLRDFWLLITAEEYQSLTSAVDASLTWYLAILHAQPTFNPPEVWVHDLFSACVRLQVFSQQRADALWGELNPPV